VLIARCPRCRAEDISADAHPTRVFRETGPLHVFVCRRCYRAAELEFRIACETAGLIYEPMTIREGLRLLRDFYLDRYAEWQDPGLLFDDAERAAGSARIREALAEVERRLAVQPVERADQ
jgi:hypothetical protein